MAQPDRGAMKRGMHRETDWFDGTAQKPARESTLGPATMKPASTGSHVSPDGINRPVPWTNPTRAPGQWGRS